MREDFCETCGKASFYDRQEALETCEEIREDDGDHVEAYRCPVGEGWHLRTKR